MNSLDTIQLSDDFFWPDEFNYTTVRQIAGRAVTGNMNLQLADKVGGRPIVLKDGSFTRAVLKQIKAMELQKSQHVLTWNGETYQVRFDYEKGPIVAKPWYEATDPDDGFRYIVDLYLLEV